jgi:hypothetical protein
MWTAAGVALVATIVAVMSFLSRGKAIKQVGEMGAQIDALEDIVASLLQEIEALAAGDHGLDHADMLDVLLPRNLRDDTRDDS